MKKRFTEEQIIAALQEESHDGSAGRSGVALDQVARVEPRKADTGSILIGVALGAVAVGLLLTLVVLRGT